MEMGIAILLTAAAASAIYSWLLSLIQHIYSPDHIWLTVVGGNALIGALFAWWLWSVPLPPQTFAAFWRLLALNVAAGIPIIGWQVGQNAARRVQREGRRHGASATRGKTAD